VKWVAAGLCGFELGAILTGRYPTLSRLSQQHRWLGPVLLVSLAVHLARQPRPPYPPPLTFPEAP
jgi:hypothetical protein